MAKVPERELSSGELFGMLHLAYKKNQERKARFLQAKRRKARRTVPTEHSREDLLKRINELNEEYKGY